MGGKVGRESISRTESVVIHEQSHGNGEGSESVLDAFGIWSDISVFTFSLGILT